MVDERLRSLAAGLLCGLLLAASTWAEERPGAGGGEPFRPRGAVLHLDSHLRLTLVEEGEPTVCTFHLEGRVPMHQRRPEGRVGSGLLSVGESLARVLGANHPGLDAMPQAAEAPAGGGEDPGEAPVYLGGIGEFRVVEEDCPLPAPAPWLAALGPGGGLRAGELPQGAWLQPALGMASKGQGGPEAPSAGAPWASAQAVFRPLSEDLEVAFNPLAGGSLDRASFSWWQLAWGLLHVEEQTAQIERAAAAVKALAEAYQGRSVHDLYPTSPRGKGEDDPVARQRRLAFAAALMARLPTSGGDLLDARGGSGDYLFTGWQVAERDGDLPVLFTRSFDGPAKRLDENGSEVEERTELRLEVPVVRLQEIWMGDPEEDDGTIELCVDEGACLPGGAPHWSWLRRDRAPGATYQADQSYPVALRIGRPLRLRVALLAREPQTVEVRGTFVVPGCGQGARSRELNLGPGSVELRALPRGVGVGTVALASDGPIRNEVAADTIRIEWEAQSAEDDAPVTVVPSRTEHRIYSVLAPAAPPVETLWAKALEVATDLARCEDDSEAVLSALTQGVFSSRWRRRTKDYRYVQPQARFVYFTATLTRRELEHLRRHGLSDFDPDKARRKRRPEEKVFDYTVLDWLGPAEDPGNKAGLQGRFRLLALITDLQDEGPADLPLLCTDAANLVSALANSLGVESRTYRIRAETGHLLVESSSAAGGLLVGRFAAAFHQVIRFRGKYYDPSHVPLGASEPMTGNSGIRGVRPLDRGPMIVTATGHRVVAYD